MELSTWHTILSFLSHVSGELDWTHRNQNWHSEMCWHSSRDLICPATRLAPSQSFASEESSLCRNWFPKELPGFQYAEGTWFVLNYYHFWNISSSFLFPLRCMTHRLAVVIFCRERGSRNWQFKFASVVKHYALGDGWAVWIDWDECSMTHSWETHYIISSLPFHLGCRGVLNTP